MKRMWMAALLLGLAACSGASGGKDYDAMAACDKMGYSPGTAEYDQCVQNEKTSRLMQQQQQEFDQMKQDQEDWKKRGY